MGWNRKFIRQTSINAKTKHQQKYLPEDYKGKGEPSFTIEKALKDHEKSAHRRVVSDGNGNNSYEMQPQSTMNRQRSASNSNVEPSSSSKPSGSLLRYADFEGDMRRSNTTGRRMGEGLKRRFGSLRKSKKTTEV
jgi:hypothetical protein